MAFFPLKLYKTLHGILKEVALILGSFLNVQYVWTVLGKKPPEHKPPGEKPPVYNLNQAIHLTPHTV